LVTCTIVAIFSYYPAFDIQFEVAMASVLVFFFALYEISQSVEVVPISFIDEFPFAKTLSPKSFQNLEQEGAKNGKRKRTETGKDGLNCK